MQSTESGTRTRMIGGYQVSVVDDSVLTISTHSDVAIVGVFAFAEMLAFALEAETHSGDRAIVACMLGMKL
jgi:hypothetical protein